MEQLQFQLADVTESINSLWVIKQASMCFFLQAGFGVLEAGSVRSKNSRNVLLKNIINISVCTLTFWAFGYAFAFGYQRDSDGSVKSGQTNGFIGNWNFFLTDFEDYVDFFNQWALSAIAVTIMSGSLAERTRFEVYMVTTAALSGFIYPVVAHWLKSPHGWLSPKNSDPFAGNGIIDFAGSGSVHLASACCGRLGAAIVGPRRGRFDEQNRPVPIHGHSTPLATLGALIMWFSWYGLHGLASYGITDNFRLVNNLVAFNTTIAGASGCIVALLRQRLYYGVWDVSVALNGLISGLASVSASSAIIDGWGALCIGAIGGMLYLFGRKTLLELKIDDPIDSFPVHGFCGAWSMLSVGLFSSRELVVAAYPSLEGKSAYGLFKGGGWKQLGLQISGIFIITLWSLAMSLLTYVAIGLTTSGLRVSDNDEDAGLDYSVHGAVQFKGSQHPATELSVFADGRARPQRTNPSILPINATGTPQREEDDVLPRDIRLWDSVHVSRFFSQLGLPDQIGHSALQHGLSGRNLLDLDQQLLIDLYGDEVAQLIHKSVCSALHKEKPEIQILNETGVVAWFQSIGMDAASTEVVLRNCYNGMALMRENSTTILREFGDSAGRRLWSVLHGQYV